MSFSREVTLTGQLNKVTVCGTDELNAKMITSSATTVTKTGSKTAADQYSIVKSRVESIYDPAVRDVKEAEIIS